jgi:hypothetical protein
MSPKDRARVLTLVKLLAGEEEYRWLDRVAIRDLGLGYDRFGME